MARLCGLAGGRAWLHQLQLWRNPAAVCGADQPLGSGPLCPPSSVSGYQMVASDGGIFSFGTMPFCGSMGATPLNAPVVGLAATPSHGGYWEVASDGGIFAFGNAGFYGSMGGTPSTGRWWASPLPPRTRVLGADSGDVIGVTYYRETIRPNTFLMEGRGIRGDPPAVD